MREAHRRELPRKGSLSAPRTWDGQPDRLPQFLKELEELFDDYRIKGRERVPAMLDYVDTLPEGMIRELKGFRDRNFERLTEELRDLMGQPRERAKYRFADLEAMTNNATCHSFKLERDFQVAYMQFLQISGWLINAGKLRSEERDFCFWNMFSPSMQKKLKARLAVKLPDHPRREAYPMSDVHTAALYLLDNDAFDSKVKGDSQTWLERERDQQQAIWRDTDLPQFSTHQRQSPSLASSSSGQRESTRGSQSASPVGWDTWVHWRDWEPQPQPSRESGNSMQDLLE
jgi:hypothetical protein